MFTVRFRPGLLSSGFKRPGFGVWGSNRPTSTSSGFKMDFFREKNLGYQYTGLSTILCTCAGLGLAGLQEGCDQIFKRTPKKNNNASHSSAADSSSARHRRSVRRGKAARRRKPHKTKLPLATFMAGGADPPEETELSSAAPAALTLTTRSDLKTLTFSSS